MWCAADINNDTLHTCANVFFLVFRFVVKQSLTTYQIFHEIAPIFKYSQIKGNF